MHDRILMHDLESIKLISLSLAYHNEKQEEVAGSGNRTRTISLEGYKL